MSAQGLQDNPGLVLFAVLAQLLSAMAFILMLGMTLLAYEHGDVVPNSAPLPLYPIPHTLVQKCTTLAGPPLMVCGEDDPLVPGSARLKLTGVITRCSACLWRQMEINGVL